MNGPMQPDYVTYDVKGREGFLSQWGNFSPLERELFHRMAKMWSPEISYSTVLNIASSESVTAKSDIESLFKKLRTAKTGLITTKMQDGTRLPQSIVLTNPDDYFFYHKLVEEELMEVVYAISLPLPSQQSLSAKGIIIPEKYIADINYEELAAIHGLKEAKQYQIYRLAAKGFHFYFTGHIVKRFVTVALAKIQTYLQNSNLASAIAKIKNLSLLDLKKQVEAREPAFWTQLAKDILENKDAIRSDRKVQVDDHFWSIAFFLHGFLFHQLEEVRKRKQAEEERLLDMKTLFESIKSVPTFIMREAEFSEAFLRYKEKYDKTFEEFKSDFEKRYLETPDRKALPPIVHIARSYIHHENVHALFLMMVEKLSRELFALYVRFMEQYLKRSTEGSAPMFYSRDNFENDIADRIKDLEPIMYELLQRPNLVAEAIILSMRKHKDAKSAIELKAGLQAFFYTDKIRFRDLAVLFGLNLVEVFRFSFLKLSIIRQVIMKLTGKHESFAKKFKDFVADTFASETEGKKGVSASLASISSAQTVSERGQTTKEERRQNRSAGGGSANGSKRGTSPAKPAVKKSYTSQEQESAWKEFGKTIKK